MTTQHITDPTYTPFGEDDVCEVRMATSGQRGGVDVTVTWGVDDPEDGLEFFELTYNFSNWEAAGWFLHAAARR